MERTESIVVQVAPEYENDKIKEMEMFGWNLQGRQEIHEMGDTRGGPNWTGTEYHTRTKVYHYVKLHFTRSLSLPHLDRIKQIESEYFSLPFPKLPTPPAGVAMFMGLMAFVTFIIVAMESVFFALISTGVIIILGYFVVKLYSKRYNECVKIREQSNRRREELKAELSSLLATEK